MYKFLFLFFLKKKKGKSKKKFDNKIIEEKLDTTKTIGSQKEK